MKTYLRPAVLRLYKLMHRLAILAINRDSGPQNETSSLNSIVNPMTIILNRFGNWLRHTPRKLSFIECKLREQQYVVQVTCNRLELPIIRNPRVMAGRSWPCASSKTKTPSSPGRVEIFNSFNSDKNESLTSNIHSPPFIIAHMHCRPYQSEL